MTLSCPCESCCCDGRRDGRGDLRRELSVPGYEALLISESADPIFREYGFEFGSLEEAFNHATSVFGDHHRAARWLEAALPGIHANTHRILKQNWLELLRRAHELDQTLKRSV